MANDSVRRLPHSSLFLEERQGTFENVENLIVEPQAPLTTRAMQGIMTAIRYISCVGTRASATPSDPETLFGEAVIFHQKTDVMRGLVRERSEVTITTDSVVLKQEDSLRGLSIVIRQRGKDIDRNLVRGYEAGLVVPSCGQLCRAILGSVFCVIVLAGGFDKLASEVPRVILEIDYKRIASFSRFFGGTCGQLFGACDKTHTPTVGEALGLNSTLRSRPAKKLSDHGVAKKKSSHAAVDQGNVIRNKPPCHDFPKYTDREGSDCSAYANPRWKFSCENPKVDPSAINQMFQSRVDEVFGLRPDHACCVCGGGEVLARHMVSTKFANVLLPLILSHPDVAPSLTSSSVLISALQESANSDLFALGELFMRMSVLELATDASSLPSEVSDILKKLQGTASHEEMSRSSLLQDNQQKSEGRIHGHAHSLHTHLHRNAHIALARESRNELAQDAKDSKRRKHSEPLSWFEQFSPTVLFLISVGIRNVVAIRCIIHLSVILALVHGVLRILQWFAERFVLSRIYVVLKVDRHFFGDAPPPTRWQNILQKHTITDSSGFYLPDATWCPGRLPALSAALLLKEAPYQLELEHIIGLEGIL